MPFVFVRYLLLFLLCATLFLTHAVTPTPSSAQGAASMGGTCGDCEEDDDGDDTDDDEEDEEDPYNPYDPYEQNKSGSMSYFIPQKKHISRDRVHASFFSGRVEVALMFTPEDVPDRDQLALFSVAVFDASGHVRQISKYFEQDYEPSHEQSDDDGYIWNELSGQDFIAELDALPFGKGYVETGFLTIYPSINDMLYHPSGDEKTSDELRDEIVERFGVSLDVLPNRSTFFNGDSSKSDIEPLVSHHKATRTILYKRASDRFWDAFDDFFKKCYDKLFRKNKKKPVDGPDGDSGIDLSPNDDGLDLTTLPPPKKPIKSCQMPGGGKCTTAAPTCTNPVTKCAERVTDCKM